MKRHVLEKTPRAKGCELALRTPLYIITHLYTTPTKEAIFTQGVGFEEQREEPE
jgi:hypothetical protein